MTVPLPTSVQTAGAAVKKTAKKNTNTVIPAICEMGLARRSARTDHNPCTATPRPNGSRTVMRMRQATDAAGICSGRLKTCASTRIATGTRTIASTPEATTQADRVRMCGSCFYHFSRQYREDRGHRQRDQGDVHCLMKIKDEYDRNCNYRHEHVHYQDRANERSRSAKQVCGVVHAGSEPQRKDQQQRTRYHQE